MSTPAASVKLTYDDYVHIPQDGRRHEILDGEHYVTPAPGTGHQSAVGNLYFALAGHLRGRDAGRVLLSPYDVLLSDTDVVQPDLVYVSRDRLEHLTDKNLQGAPDLAVEVLSESTRRVDEIVKRRLYERFGVREYWVVDPVVETVKVYRPDAEGAYRRETELSLEAEDVLASPLLPGLEIPLGQIFRAPWGAR